MMTANEIRKRFLKFFEQKNHTIVESDSLVPKNDPTVLFTTAGMQQFKRQFFGFVDEYRRASTAQKCLRTDDLDQVGKTDFHHTFFEMLGNFSFGDYFKKDAILWGWEFLTKEMKIPAEKLWVSVYQDDVEAKEIWLREVKIPLERIVALGDKSNFWPSDAKLKGPNGPCGPCSEIFFDYGVNPNCTSKTCDPSCDCGRFSEIWNLVFTQFDRRDAGVLEPLPNKNIDTGMGFERLTAVIQGKRSNYETDLFAPIIEVIEKDICGGKIKLSQFEKRVIADHIRAVVFGIADGIIPSNKERGSVMKRLIVDSSNLVLDAGGTEASFYKLVTAVVEVMKEPYPYLVKKEKDIRELIRKTEEAFILVRQQRIPELRQLNLLAMTSEERGALYFRYQDTYGLPLPTIINVSCQQGVAVNVISEDKRFYNQFMEQQKERSRASSKMSGDVFTGTELELDVPKTKFLGYDHCESTSTLLKIFINSQNVNDVGIGDEVKVILDKTPFYAESGGQVGDTGTIFNGQNRIRITDTHKTDDIYVHTGVVESGKFRRGEVVQSEVDCQRRSSIMRNHTATHLLQAALREVLGAHVQQQGSLVAEDKLRFDFTHPKPITPDEVKNIERYVMEAILECESVNKEFLDIEQARSSGALAFFAEKYGKVVRVVSIGNRSKEFCGGTHLDSTGQIGIFKVVGENAIAQGIRRIEAKTGWGAIAHIDSKEKLLDEVAKLLKAPVQELAQRVGMQAQRLKNLEKELESLRLESLKSSIDTILAKAENLNGTKMISHSFENIDMPELRKLIDLIKQKVVSSVIVLGARTDENGSLLISVSDDLIKKGLKADEVIREVAPIMGGSGGGRAQIAQAGTKDISKIELAVKEASRLIKAKINL
jgi:alanyl-tRNA synthetase